MSHNERTLGVNKNTWIPVFFAVAACSWMPNWACHYYRLETGSSFVVGSWEFLVGLFGLTCLAVAWVVRRS